MIQTSEWVSPGHSDKVADFISSYILDRYIEQDPKTRFALEVQIKDNFVSLAGEVTSQANFPPERIADFVREAVNKIGYTAQYQRQWGPENTICGNDIEVVQHIGQQSPDIAQGVNADGWGDQGIFHGMAVNDPDTDYMPKDWWLARKIGMHLYETRYAGIDIKTQVTMRDGKIDEIVVAIPMTHRHFTSDVEVAVAYCCGGSRDYRVFVNGTGKFMKHGPVGDAGTTGRKLAVDFYGGNCKIGGGSPWTKEGTKADLTLNLLARERALDYVQSHPEMDVVYCSIACRIGSPRILCVLTDAVGNTLQSGYENITPAELIRHFRLDEPRFARMCMYGLFS